MCNSGFIWWTKRGPFNNLNKTLGLGVTLTNNQIKDFIKVIRSLEKIGILLKGTTKDITCQEGVFLNFVRPLMTTALPLMKNKLILLTKSVLVPLGLTAAASATDKAIKKKFFEWGMTTLVFSNKNLNDVTKLVKYLQESGLLIKGVSEITKGWISSYVIWYVSC